MSPSSSEPVEWKLLLKDKNGQGERAVPPRLVSFGSDGECDINVATRGKGVLFSLLAGATTVTLIRGHESLDVNGERMRAESAILKPGDLLQWKDGHAVLMSDGRSANAGEPKTSKVLELLSKFSSLIQERGAVERGSHLILEEFLKWSGAERAVLVNERSDGSGWQKVAERSLDPRLSTSPRELMSHTVLAEALRKSEPVIAENLLEHPWSRAHSLVGQRIFSLACTPLLVDGRPIGALFLFTHTPGKSINRNCLTDLALLAGQASLILATQKELQRLRRGRVLPAVQDGSRSRAYADLLARLDRVAQSPLPVLVQGETGSGKERIARMIHEKSRVAQGPFVALNCAAIPETLLESTLFGHEKGAFTGAHKSQPGRFQLADGGTLFLDEIGDLSLPLQAKILRALQEGEVDPVGSVRPVKVRVRVVSATHRNLDRDVEQKRFREDLYFRIKGAQLLVPPLRERFEDLPFLCAEILAESGTGATLAPESLAGLAAHRWPGNIRELKQVLEQAAWTANDLILRPEDLQLSTRQNSVDSDDWNEARPLREAQEEFTQSYIERVLAACDGHRSLAAQKLGISERTLYRLLSELPSPDIPGSGN